jgi:hypothetical protein
MSKHRIRIERLEQLIANVIGPQLQGEDARCAREASLIASLYRRALDYAIKAGCGADAARAFASLGQPNDAAIIARADESAPIATDSRPHGDHETAIEQILQMGACRVAKELDGRRPTADDTPGVWLMWAIAATPTEAYKALTARHRAYR